MKRRSDDARIVSFEELERRRKAGREGFRKPRPRKLYREFPLLVAHARLWGRGEPEPVEIANLPFNSDGYALFRALAAADPGGWFRAYDGTPVAFRDVVALPDPRNPERRGFVLPEGGTGRQPEIRVRLHDSGHEVELWNLPDDELGRMVYDRLAEAHPDCDVMTSDFGYVPLELMKRL